MSDVDHLAVLRAERARIVATLTGSDMDAPVPACPDWRLADLAWHLVAGMQFWQRSIEHGLDDPDEVIDRPPPPVEELAGTFDRESARLVELLTDRPPDTPTWSWHPDGGTIGWLRRRQAHELRIHRVDVEQAVGAPLTSPDPAVAADGVDEMLRVFLTGLPEWATFESDGATVDIVATDADRSWSAWFGRCVGTPPGGDHVELDCLDLVDLVDVVDRGRGDLVVSGSADELDRWLWRRLDDIEHDGDPASLRRLADLVAEVTG